MKYVSIEFLTFYLVFINKMFILWKEQLKFMY